MCLILVEYAMNNVYNNFQNILKLMKKKKHLTITL